MGLLRGSGSNFQPGLSGFSRRPLGAWSPACYVGLGLATPGQVGYDGKPGRTWIVWSGWVPGGVDDGGPGKLTFSAALSDPFLNFLEDIGDVEGQMVRRCRHHRDLGPALRELPLEDGQRQLGSDFGLAGEDRDHA